jgi:peroxiredoxin
LVVTARIRSLAAILLAAALTGCGPEPPQLQAGQPAPAFRLPTLAGEALNFPAELRGQIVALRFWADWCPFCETEMRDLEPVYLKHRDLGLRILAVNVRQDRATAERFIARLGVSYQVLLDEDGETARTYGVIGLPTTFFVDREGRLGARILGESTPELVERVLKDLL